MMCSEEARWSAKLTVTREIRQGLSQWSASRRGTAVSQLIVADRRRPAIKWPKDGAVPRDYFTQSAASSVSAQVRRQRAQAQLRLLSSRLLSVQLRVVRRTASRDGRSGRQHRHSSLSATGTLTIHCIASIAAIPDTAVRAI